LNRFINKVFNGDALNLLRVIPTASVDAVVSDPMYGTSKNCVYEWGPDPAQGNPALHWLYHRPIYEECRRILKPGGVLAWAQDIRFNAHFSTWFGPHRIWTLARFLRKGGRRVTGLAWIVQTQDRRPIRFPDRDGLVLNQALGNLCDLGHPCIKPVEEMVWMIEALTKPGQIILDCFSGLGSTLVAAQELGRLWIGCDKGRQYCQVAMRRLAELAKPKVASANGHDDPRCPEGVVN
jgi:hypothetical protein